LSNDHTPYVKSEYARILQNNGRVKKTKSKIIIMILYVISLLEVKFINL